MSLLLGSSAAERVSDCRADPSHGVVVDLSDGTGERCLNDGVETITVDDRGSIQPDLDVVDVNFHSETTDGGGDLGHRNEAASAEHLGSSQQQYGSPFLTNFSQPHLASFQGSPHASTSVQAVSEHSGYLR
jgi:hypothetical protein